jgi:hypothetical protein
LASGFDPRGRPRRTDSPTKTNRGLSSVVPMVTPRHQMSFRSIAQCFLFSALSISVGRTALADESPGAGSRRVASSRPETLERSAQKASDGQKEPTFRENGRFGMLGALTSDMWKAGLVFEHEHFEANVLFHAGIRDDDTRDLHVIFKAGGRIPLGALNYLAIGGEYGPHWGSKEYGVSTGGSFHAGPYLSLQRYFAKTPLMINLWVCPASYEYFENATPAGARTSTKALNAFRQGGFGLAYLF